MMSFVREFFQKIGHWLNVCPHFVGTPDTPRLCKSCKIIGGLKIFLLASFSVYAINYVAETANAFHGFCGVVVEVMEYVSSVLFVVVGILKVSFGDVGNFVAYFEKLAFVEGFLKSANVVRVRSDRVFGLVVFLFVLQYPFWGIFDYLGKEDKSVGFIVFWIVGIFCSAYEVIVPWIYVNKVVELKRRYEDLNSFLKNIKHEMRSAKIRNEYKNTEKNLGNIVNASKLYRLLHDVTGSLNKSYGWQILLVFFHFETIILAAFNILMVEVLKILKGTGYHTTQMGFLLFYISSLLIICIAICAVCDSACNTGRDTIDLCVDLQQYFPLRSLERKEVLRLIDMVEKLRPQFSAAGFFDLDRTILFSMISTATNYFIVILQFQIH